MDTPPEECFDALTRLAAQTVGAPTAILSLVDSDRQFFKSVFPVGGGVTPGWHKLGETFCHLVVQKGEAVTVSDWANERPLEGQEIHAGSYAGVPLANDRGSIVGTLCVIDVTPRAWTRRELDTLYAFAHAAVAEIQRRVAERATHDTQLRLVAERTLAHAVQHQMPVGVVVAESPSGRLISVNAQMTA
ncbi:MAG TPA: GAF domain-containing protein, partial [Gemmatimonadaceae bacterium]|nr:GAF domain-containing protein [Gemmatimonadaceae bacterium]